MYLTQRKWNLMGLLLNAGARDAYELTDGLPDRQWVDPSSVRQTLRAMERQGLVRSFEAKSFTRKFWELTELGVLVALPAPGARRAVPRKFSAKWME